MPCMGMSLRVRTPHRGADAGGIRRKPAMVGQMGTTSKGIVGNGIQDGDQVASPLPAHSPQVDGQAPISEELVFKACMIPLLLRRGFKTYSVIFFCPISFSLGASDIILTDLLDRKYSEW
ncbi:hypothetical protein RHMOL_Rhmol13G0166600 [Rhododendron molle]|uniref:Uncharacterized protein n=1 Tax=Rhododendron molle TaxID=49168 RepID=A0ACC0L7Z4_RHOML|nr:hypothetical protein RHMOL_Rhmol13G0166600 [Rhododendron molle]